MLSKSKCVNKNTSYFARVFIILQAFLLIYIFSSPKMGDNQAEYQYPYVSFKIQPAYKPDCPVLRVIMPQQDKMLRIDSPYGPGMEAELLKTFIGQTDYKIRPVYADNCEEALKLLAAKRGDLVVGFGGELSFERKKDIAQGPVYINFYPTVVDISSRSLPQKFLEHAEASMGRLTLGAAGQHVYDADNVKTSKKMVLLDPETYAVLMPMHKGAQTKGRSTDALGYRWFWLVDNKDMTRRMSYFWKDSDIVDMVAEMQEQYYGFMPDTPKHYALRELAHIVAISMEEYRVPIMKAAEATNLDPLLIAAVIFQESRFNPAAKSFTGVRGIMQLTTNTANMLNVNRLDPEECIMGGARYLRAIWDSLEHLGLEDWDRWCLTLASFNQGPTIMGKAIRSLQASGKTANWAELRDIYPNLREQGIASSSFRGDEAVSYVENVRYYYYVLSALASIAGPEDQHLAPLLAFTGN